MATTRYPKDETTLVEFVSESDNDSPEDVFYAAARWIEKEQVGVVGVCLVYNGDGIYRLQLVATTGG